MSEFFYPVKNMEAANVNMPTPRPSKMAMDDELREIINILYDAAIGADEKWGEALKRLRITFNSSIAQIYCMNFQTQQFEINILEGHGVGVQVLTEFEMRAFEDKPIGVVLCFPDCALASNLHFAPEIIQERVDTGFVPAQVGQFLVIVNAKSPYWDGLAIMRHMNAEGFTIKDCDRLGTCLEDLKRIAAIIHARSLIASDPVEARAIIKDIRYPLGVASANGAQIYLNENAEILFENCETYPFATPAWSNCFKEAVRLGRAKMESQTCTIVAKKIDIEVNDDKLAVFNYGVANLLLSFENISAPRKEIAFSSLAKYRLSAREIEIANLFSKGNNAQKIAKILNKSKETIRSQLRSIREKLCVNSQIEMASLLKSLEFE